MAKRSKRKRRGHLPQVPVDDQREPRPLALPAPVHRDPGALLSRHQANPPRVVGHTTPEAERKILD